MKAGMENKRERDNKRGEKEGVNIKLIGPEPSNLDLRQEYSIFKHLESLS